MATATPSIFPLCIIFTKFWILSSLMAVTKLSHLPLSVLHSNRSPPKRNRSQVKIITCSSSFGEIVRKDFEYLKKGFGWASEALHLPKFSKAVDHVIWLRHLEKPYLPPQPPCSFPQPLYPGLTGVDLVMADIEALKAYGSYLQYLSRMWSRPLPEVYEPQEIEDYFNCRPHVVTLRFLEVFFSFTFAAIKLRTSEIFRTYGSGVDKEGNNSDYYFGQTLKETMLSLGPTFIKVGQSLSTRPDIIGSEISKALSELHDQIPPFPRTEAMQIVEEDLGSPITSIFSYISEEPVAAASFGQVYHGRTQDGHNVAIKVQRPNLHHAVVRDIYILRLGLGFVQKVARRKSDLRLYADELGKGLVGELDYTLEAANASEFRDVHSSFPFMYVPKVYRHLSRKRVLTMEWVVGESPNDLFSVSTRSLSDYDSGHLERQQIEAKKRLLDLVSKGVESSLIQLLETGLLHADPHPGNLLYTATGKIGFLDFGLVCRMEKKHQFAMLSSIVHIVNGDWPSLVNDLSDMDVARPGTNIRRVTMDLEDALGEVEFKDGIPDVKFSRVLGQIWSVAFKYHFRMPPYYTLVLRSLASLEGLAVAADRNFKTFDAAFPYVVQKLLTDNSVAARKILHSVVFNKRKEFQWTKIALFFKAGSNRKSLQKYLRPNSNENGSFDVAHFVFKVLPSKDGAVLRRIMMTADGASLVEGMISKEATVYRKQFSIALASVLYQWMSQCLQLPSTSSSPVLYDYESVLRDARLKLIFFKAAESVRRKPALMLRLSLASLVVFVSAFALACHRILVTWSEKFIASISFSPRMIAFS